MSFPRAKRFDYKDPDISVSPADYYITSSGYKPISLSKCPRFVSKDDVSSFANASLASCKCRKNHQKCLSVKEESTRYRKSQPSEPHASSTPHMKKMLTLDIKTIKEKISCLSRDDISRLSFRKKSTKPTSSDIVYKPKTIKSTKLQVPSSEDAYDDDYYSYTSSDELDSLTNRKRSMMNNQNDFRKTYFKEHILQQIHNINEEIKKLKQEIKTKNKPSNKYIKNINQISCCSDLSMATDISGEIRCIIQKAIDNLRSEFELKYDMLQSDATSKIRNLAREMYKTSQESKIAIGEVCRSTASNLSEEVLYFLQNDQTLENEACKSYVNYDYTFMSPEKGSSFSYENICKILSEQLQISHRELEELKREQNSITNKFEKSNETIQAQSSIINQLYENLTDLKKSF